MPKSYIEYKCACLGHGTITNCRATKETVRKGQRTIIVAFHQEEHKSKATQDTIKGDKNADSKTQENTVKINQSRSLFFRQDGC